jgi:hypothetical protein
MYSCSRPTSSLCTHGVGGGGGVWRTSLPNGGVHPAQGCTVQLPWCTPRAQTPLTHPVMPLPPAYASYGTPPPSHTHTRTCAP